MRYKFEKNTLPNGPMACPLASGPSELFGTCMAHRAGGSDRVHVQRVGNSHHGVYGGLEPALVAAEL